jgi:hypothetical protein
MKHSQNTIANHRQSVQGHHHSDGLIAGGGRGVEGAGEGGGGLAKSRYSRRRGFFRAVDCTNEKQLFVIQYIKMPCSTAKRTKSQRLAGEVCAVYDRLKIDVIDITVKLFGLPEERHMSVDRRPQQAPATSNRIEEKCKTNKRRNAKQIRGEKRNI